MRRLRFAADWLLAFELGVGLCSVWRLCHSISVQCVGESSNEPVALCIHPGADGCFQLYEDDGETFDYRRGRYRLIELLWAIRGAG